MIESNNTMEIALQELDRLNLPGTSNMSIGISQHQMEAQTKYLPYSLPVELSAFYQWHNGYPATPFSRQIFCDGSFYDLSFMIAQYQDLLELAKYDSKAELLANPHIDMLDSSSWPSRMAIWYPNWYPVLMAAGDDICFIDVTEDRMNMSPVFNWHFEAPTPILIYDSLISMVQTTIETFQSKARWFDSAGYVQTNDLLYAEVTDTNNPFRRTWLLRFANNAQSIEEVVEQLTNKDNKVRSRASIVIGQLHDKRTLPRLRELSNHSDDWVRFTAKNHLKTLQIS